MDRERNFAQMNPAIDSGIAAQLQSPAITSILISPVVTMATLVNANLDEGIKVKKFTSEQGAGCAPLAD